MDNPNGEKTSTRANPEQITKETTYDPITAKPPLLNTSSDRTPPAMPMQQNMTNPPSGGFPNNRQISSSVQSQPYNIYSPGICVNQPYPRERGKSNVNALPKPKREQKISASGILFAICIVLICTLFSAAATAYVVDLRLSDIDLNPAPTIIREAISSTEYQRDENYVPSVTTLPDGMLPQDIYDLALTQVVGINTEAPGSSGLFEDQRSTTPVSGSGFIISSDGYILTNYHVIELAHASNFPITVVMYDGSDYDAQVVGFEASSDVAIIKIDASGLNPVFIGDSDNIRVGQQAYAVGNPFGDYVYTMTDGIVSALDRVVSIEGNTINTFQFSAAVNSGNSGGPVYNARGEVIGIVTAKVNRGNVEGIGFAIPINDAMNIALLLIEHGYISGRPLLGITVQTVTSANAEYFGWVVGVYIRSVYPDSAAEKAGLVVGDIIVAIADEDVDSLEALRFALRQHNAGDTANITVWRNGETIVLSITFDEDMNAGRPERPAVPEPDTPDPFETIP